MVINFPCSSDRHHFSFGFPISIPHTLRVTRSVISLIGKRGTVTPLFSKNPTAKLPIAVRKLHAHPLTFICIGKFICPKLIEKKEFSLLGEVEFEQLTSPFRIPLKYRNIIIHSFIQLDKKSNINSVRGGPFTSALGLSIQCSSFFGSFFVPWRRVSFFP